MPEAFLFVQFQACIKNAAHQAHDRRPGNNAGGQGAGRGRRMGIIHQLPAAADQIQAGKLGIKQLLQIGFPYKQEYMGGLGNPGSLGRPGKAISRFRQLP